jgi:hypothetical protein
MLKEAELVTLVSAALIATVVRLFFYLVGGKEGSYLRESIGNMGVTVVLLEICIVMLRFFTTFSMMERIKHYIDPRYNLIVFTIMGMSITLLWTTLPGIVIDKPDYANDAVMYLSNRPFEAIPIIVEYTSLYLLHNRVFSQRTSLTILCAAIISVIIAISDVKEHGNTIVQPIQNWFVARKTSREPQYLDDFHKIPGPKEPLSLDHEDL